MLLKIVIRLTLVLLALPLTIQAQVRDTMVVRHLLEQAASIDSSDLAKEKYETAYALASQWDYDRGVLESLDHLIPLELAANNTSNALRYLLEEMELLEKYDKTTALVLVNTQVGNLYHGESLYEEALSYYKRAESMLSPSADKSLQKRLYNNLGFCYTQLLKPDSAQQYYARLINLADGDQVSILGTLRNTVSAYQLAGQYEKSLPYSRQMQSLLAASPKWEDELGIIYNNLGYTYNHLGDYEQSIEWFLQAKDYLKADQEQLAVLYTNLGIAYFNNQNLPLAIQYLLRALSQTAETDNHSKGNINNILANIHLQSEDYFNAQNYNRDAIQYALQSGDSPLTSEVYATAAEIHSRLFEYEEAIQAYRTHRSLRDSMAIETRLEQERLLQDKFRLEKTEKEIKLLLIRGEIQDLTIEQLESDRERQKLEIDNLNLAADQRNNALEILQQSEEIKEAKLRNQELVTQRTQQELLLVQGRLTLQKQEQQLSELAQAEALAQTEVEKKEALLTQEAQRITLLEKESEIQQQTAQATQRIGILLFLLLVLILVGLFYTRKTNKKLTQQKIEIEAERQKSERLLENILPESVARELKETGKTTPRKYNSVSILFSDFVDFTRISSQTTSEQVIAELNDCFKGFDAIAEEEGIEKIQTIGDGYLAVGGIPDEAPDHAVRCVSAAKRMIAFLDQRNLSHDIQWRARIGIHSGPITTGVVGTKKFSYNIFGDTVNTASRLETAGAQDRINVSVTTYNLIKDHFDCEYRGKIAAKGKGELDMYFVK